MLKDYVKLIILLIILILIVVGAVFFVATVQSETLIHITFGAVIGNLIMGVRRGVSILELEKRITKLENK